MHFSTRISHEMTLLIIYIISQILYISFIFIYVFYLYLFLFWYIFSADVLVTVRAQVMTRDENAGGWLALDGGGLAIVSVRRRPRLTPITDETGNVQTHEYIIYGQRISDQSVSIFC